MTVKLTLFACPKPFAGHIGIIQRNAVKSWTQLEPRPDVLLLGNEEGTAEIARELDVRHIPEIGCTPAGTPLVSEIFKTAHERSDTAWLAYINADIILLDDFPKALAMLEREMEGAGIDRFFFSCQRTDIDVRDPIHFEDSDWRAGLHKKVANEGVKVNVDAIDLFLYSRGIFRELPPFALGRSAWDNYLVWKAKDEGAAVIDASDAFLLMHQCHDYGHAGNWKNAWTGEEARKNQQLAEGCRLTIPEAAAYVLTREGLKEQKSEISFSHAKLIRLRVELGLREMQRGNAKAAMDYLDDAWMWLENLQTSKDWFEAQSIEQKAWVEEQLRKSEESLAHARETYQEQQAWIQELQKGKDWLESHWRAWMAATEDLQKHVAVLNEEKAALATERDRLQQQVEELQAQLDHSNKRSTLSNSLRGLWSK